MVGWHHSLNGHEFVYNSLGAAWLRAVRGYIIARVCPGCRMGVAWPRAARSLEAPPCAGGAPACGARPPAPLVSIFGVLFDLATPSLTMDFTLLWFV